MNHPVTNDKPRLLQLHCPAQKPIARLRGCKESETIVFCEQARANTVAFARNLKAQCGNFMYNQF